MTVDLDTRMQAASDSLRRASERLGGDPPPVGNHARRTLVVAVVVVVVALVAGGVTLLRSDDDRRSHVLTVPSGVPRLVLDRAPEGMPPTGAVDLPLASAQQPATMRVSVYGDPDADDPFADVDLGIYVVDQEGSITDGEPGTEHDGASDDETVTVRGREATVETESTGVALIWEEEPGRHISVVSRSLDGDRLAAIAEGLVVDGDEVDLGTVPPGVPAELAPIGTVIDLQVGMTVPLPASAPGHVVGYQDEDGARVIVVGTFTGDASQVAVIRWMNNAREPVDVRGHAGWIGSQEAGDGVSESAESGSGSSSSGTATSDGTNGDAATSSTVVWEESPGVWAVVEGFGLDEAEVLAAAEGLRPATDAEWRQLLVDPSSDDDSDQDTDVRSESESNSGSGVGSGSDGGSASDSGTGGGNGNGNGEGSARSILIAGLPEDAVIRLVDEYADGAWAVYTTADGELCGLTTSASSGSEVCTPTDEPVSTLHDNGGNPVLVFGVMPPGAVDVRTQGAATTWTNVDRGYYALAIDDWSTPTEVVFVDSQDEVVETAPIDP